MLCLTKLLTSSDLEVNSTWCMCCLWNSDARKRIRICMWFRWKYFLKCPQEGFIGVWQWQLSSAVCDGTTTPPHPLNTNSPCLLVLLITLATPLFLSVLLSITAAICGRWQFSSSMFIRRSTAMVSQKGLRSTNTHTLTHQGSENKQIGGDTWVSPCLSLHTVIITVKTGGSLIFP